MTKNDFEKKGTIEFFKIWLPPPYKKIEDSLPEIYDTVLKITPNPDAFKKMSYKKQYEHTFPLIEKYNSKTNEDTKLRFLSSPEQRIRDSEKVKKVMPEIEKLRKRLFKTKTPRFRGDMDKAIDWLKAEAEKDMRLAREENKEGTERLLPIPLGVKGALDYLIVWRDTELGFLENETRRIWFETRITQDSLVMYVLTGIKPRSPIYSISREEVIKAIDTDRHAIIAVTDFPVKLEIFKPVTNKEFKKIFNEMKSHVEEKVIISKKHERLYWLVEEMSPPPKKKSSPRGAVMKFWREVLRVWNEKYKDEKYQDADTIMRTYVRMMKKLPRYIFY